MNSCRQWWLRSSCRQWSTKVSDGSDCQELGACIDRQEVHVCSKGKKFLTELIHKKFPSAVIDKQLAPAGNDRRTRSSYRQSSTGSSCGSHQRHVPVGRRFSDPRVAPGSVEQTDFEEIPPLPLLPASHFNNFCKETHCNEAQGANRDNV